MVISILPSAYCRHLWMNVFLIHAFRGLQEADTQWSLHPIGRDLCERGPPLSAEPPKSTVEDWESTICLVPPTKYCSRLCSTVSSLPPELCMRLSAKVEYCPCDRELLDVEMQQYSVPPTDFAWVCDPNVSLVLLSSLLKRMKHCGVYSTSIIAAGWELWFLWTFSQYVPSTWGPVLSLGWLPECWRHLYSSDPSFPPSDCWKSLSPKADFCASVRVAKLQEAKTQQMLQSLHQIAWGD